MEAENEIYKFTEVDDIKYHELSNIFPLMDGEEYSNLKNDIGNNGLLNPIVLYEEKILDGRNRHRVCKDLGIKPRFRDFEDWYPDKDPFAFIVSENLYRRHLTTAQKAEIGLILLTEEEKKAQERRKLLNKEKIKLMQIEKDKLEGYVNEQSETLRNTIKDLSKGSAMEIVADKVDISRSTLSKAKKIKNAIKKDNNIEKLWNEAKKGKIGVDKVYQEVKEKNKTNNSAPNTIDNKTLKIYKNIAKKIKLEMINTKIYKHNNDDTIRAIEDIIKKCISFLRKEFDYLF